MANTTWKQVVLDTADAYREANGTTGKIPVGQLAEKVRAGAGTPYEGDNPLTIGQAGFTFPAKTLLKDGLQIINGVNGEDLTDTVADQTTAVEALMKMVNRKIAMNNGEGQYVWKKSNTTSRLPEGYTEVEYIESTGTQKINTGVTIGSATMLLKTRLACTAPNGNDNWFMSVGASGNIMQFGTHEGTYQIILSGVNMGGKEKATTDIVNIELSLEGTTYTMSGDASFSFTASQLGTSAAFRSSPINIAWGNWRTYETELYIGGVLAGHYIPCYYSDGTAGVYDLISKTFKTNAGTGTFGVGRKHYYDFVGYAVSFDVNTYPDNALQNGYWYERVSEYEMHLDGIYLWKRLSAEGGELLGYVTASSEDAYPNGGMKDGYWYELVEEGISGVDFGEVTLSTNGGITISHNLKAVPSESYLIPKSLVTATMSTKNMSVANHNGLVESVITDGWGHLTYNYYSGYYNTCTDTEVTFTPYNSANGFCANNYIWFVKK